MSGAMVMQRATVRTNVCHLRNPGYNPLFKLTRRMGKGFVNAPPKVVSFLRVLRFPPTGTVDRMG